MLYYARSKQSNITLAALIMVSKLLNSYRSPHPKSYDLTLTLAGEPMRIAIIKIPSNMSEILY